MTEVLGRLWHKRLQSFDFSFDLTGMNMTNKYLLGALLGGGLVCLASGAVAKPASVRVTRETYRGWAGAYRLSNGTVDAVVVPQIGRVMAFHFTGRPETSPFFNNKLWLGKAAPPTPDPRNPKTFPTEWHNYGGDKLWPSPQSDWPKRQPVGWPPDPTIDTGPYTVKRLRNGLRLVGPVSPFFGVRVIRDITLRPGAARVFLQDTFTRPRRATGKLTGFPIGIWSITQVRGDATVYLPLNLKGHFPGVGLVSLTDKPGVPPNAKTHDDLLAVTRPSNVSTKIGVDNSAGWMACAFGGDLLFSEHFTRLPRATYPDKNTNAQVYTNGDDTQAYIEMEVLGPLVSLNPGWQITRAMSWQLQRLPQKPAGGAEARILIKRIMQGR